MCNAIVHSKTPQEKVQAARLLHMQDCEQNSKHTKKKRKSFSLICPHQSIQQPLAFVIIICYVQGQTNVSLYFLFIFFVATSPCFERASSVFSICQIHTYWRLPDSLHNEREEKRGENTIRCAFSSSKRSWWKFMQHSLGLSGVINTTSSKDPCLE